MTNDVVSALARLEAVESLSLPILSADIDLHPEHTEWASIVPRIRHLLYPVVQLAQSDEIDRTTSLALRSASERVIALADSLERLPCRGVAVFLCEDIDLDEQLCLPRQTWDCAVVGPTPYLRPLRALVDEFRRIAVVIVDSRRSEIVPFFMGELGDRQIIEAEELRKSDLGGWHGLDELRHRRHAEEVRSRLYREIADRLERMRRAGRVDLVLIGGHHDATQALLGYLEPRVRAMAATFVADVHLLTPESLVERVTELEARYEKEEEQRDVSDVYALAGAGDLGAIGVDRVFEAAANHAIARLFVNDGTTLEGSVCTDCGALSRPSPTCRWCGAPTRPESDVIEALCRAVIDAGGSVEHVMSDTPLGDDLVAARLRFVPVLTARP